MDTYTHTHIYVSVYIYAQILLLLPALVRGASFCSVQWLQKRLITSQNVEKKRCLNTQPQMKQANTPPKFRKHCGRGGKKKVKAGGRDRHSVVE